MKTKIEDLEIGDEILIGLNSQLLYLKVLELPRLSKTRKGWRSNKLLYINVKCSTHVEDKTYTYTNYQGNKATYITKLNKCTTRDHNTVKKFNLNDRIIWLIKRDEL